MNARAIAFAPQPLTCADLMTCDAHALTNGLYAMREVCSSGFIWTWQTTPQSRVREWVTLAAEDERIQLAIDGDASRLDAPLLDWRSCDGDTQLLAWTACHESLLDLVRTLCQRDFVPISIEDCDAEAPPDSVRVGFCVCKTDETPVASGSIRLPTLAIERCIARATRDRTPLPQHLAHVHGRLAVVLDEFLTLPHDVVQLHPDCIVRLDNSTLRTTCARITIRAGRMQLIADVRDAHARVVACTAQSNDCEHFPTGAAMNELSTDTTPHVTSVDVEALPVRLTFSAGRLTLPFGALADVKPGYVFELDRRLDDQMIVIQANDTAIAVGELVVLGDFLGVRITRMLPKARAED